MASVDPDFSTFSRALALSSLGLGPDARLRIARALFANMCAIDCSADDISGIVLWDEVEPQAFGLRR